MFNKNLEQEQLKYPVTEDQLASLVGCKAVNPMVGKSHGLKIPDSFNKGEATQEILKVRLEVSKGIYPKWFMEKYWPYNFPMPDYLPEGLKINNLSFENPQGLADIVHMDDPLDLPVSLKKVFTNPRYGGSANIKNKHGKWKQFLETVVDLNETITDYQKRYGWKVFETKWYFGLTRPEEVLSGLGPLVTAYEEGCPNHPSIGQGHMALAQSGFLALYKSLELSRAQLEDGLYTTYLWGQFRCLAGVHYGIDAILSILLVGGFNKYIKKEVKESFKETT